MIFLLLKKNFHIWDRFILSLVDRIHIYTLAYIHSHETVYMMCVCVICISVAIYLIVYNVCFQKHQPVYETCMNAVSMVRVAYTTVYRAVF